MSESWKPKVGERVMHEFGRPSPGTVMAVGDQLAIVQWDTEGEGCSNVAYLRPVDPVAELVRAAGAWRDDRRLLLCSETCSSHKPCALARAVDALRKSREGGAEA